MKNNSRGFFIRDTYQELFENLSGDQLKFLFEHIFDFMKGKDVNPSSEIKCVWIMIKQELVFQMQRNDEIKAKKTACGLKGGRPKQNNTEKPNGFFNNHMVLNESKITYNKDKDKDKDNSPVCMQTGTHADACVGESFSFSFEDFYEMYGKKLDKVNSKKEFKKLSEQEKKNLKDNLQVYIDSNPNPKYRKSPYLYLLGKNYEDIENQGFKNLTFENFKKLYVSFFSEAPEIDVFFELFKIASQYQFEIVQKLLDR